MRCVFLLSLLLAQDSEHDGLVQRLGDDDPVVREEAARALEGSAAAARKTLERGRDSSDAEVRVRAATILHRHERGELEKRLAREQRPLKLGTAIDSGSFLFRRRAWAPKGETLGTVFETAPAPSVPGEIEWDVAGIRADGPLPVERCLHHSPALVYVDGADVPECRMTVKGLRRWYCDIPVEFRRPSRGSSERVGPFLLTVRWPEILVRSDRPVPNSVFGKVLTAYSIRFKVKPGRERWVEEGYWARGGRSFG